MMEHKEILDVLKARRFSLSDEKMKLQPEIAEALIGAGIPFLREYRLDQRNIIDFLCGSIGIEVKIKGSKLNIFRQIERYAEFEEISRLILVTNVPIGLPELVKGKPVYLVNLSRAWL